MDLESGIVRGGAQFLRRADRPVAVDIPKLHDATGFDQAVIGAADVVLAVSTQLHAVDDIVRQAEKPSSVGKPIGTDQRTIGNDLLFRRADHSVAGQFGVAELRTVGPERQQHAIGGIAARFQVAKMGVIGGGCEGQIAIEDNQAARCNCGFRREAGFHGTAGRLGDGDDLGLWVCLPQRTGELELGVMLRQDDANQAGIRQGAAHGR